MSKVAAKSNAEAVEAVSSAGKQPTVERAAMTVASLWSIGFVHGELAFWDYDRAVWSQSAPEGLIKACGADEESWPHVVDAIRRLCDLKQTKMATSEQIIAAKLPDAIARTIAFNDPIGGSWLGDDLKSLRAALVESMRSNRASLVPGNDDFDTASKIMSLLSGAEERETFFPKAQPRAKWAPGKLHPNGVMDKDSFNRGSSGDKLVLSISQSAGLAVIPNIDKGVLSKKYPKTLDKKDVVAWLKAKSNVLTSEPAELVKVVMASIPQSTKMLPNSILVAAYYGLLELTGGTTNYSQRALSLIFSKLFEPYGFKPYVGKPRRLSAYIADGLFDMSSLGFLEMTPAVAEAREANAPSRAIIRP